MAVPLQPLQAQRLTRVIQSLQDARQLPQQLRFLARTRVVPATDAEVFARFTGYVQIADLIADDQRAVTYSHGKYSFESTAIPNLKLGAHMTQELINQLLALSAGQVIPGQPRDFLNATIMRTVDALLLGVRQRMEALIIAMHIDALDYDRMGIKIVNGTWGMPSDLKVTPATPWTNAGAATPVDDMLTVKMIASVRYGQEYDRATMSTAAFRLMIATTEFQNKARLALAPNVSYSNLSLANLAFQRQIAESVLGMSIEIYDARYWTQNGDGTQSSYAFLPINKVVLSSTADDNNAAVMDFANAVTTESVVGSLNDGNTAVLGGFNGPEFGPVAYATRPGDLNPPQVTMWGVARGFPRKHILQSTAVLTIGTVTDSIPVGPPF